MSRTYHEIEAEAFAAIPKRDTEAFDRLAAELEGMDDALSVCLRHLLRGYYQMYVGDPSVAITELKAGVESAESLEYSRIKGELTAVTGIAYLRMSDPENALIWFNRFLALSREANDEGGIGAALSNIGVIHFDAGDYPAALGYYRQALTHHEKGQNLQNVANTTGNIGKALNLAGQQEEALPMLEQAFQLHLDAGNTSGASSVASSISDILWDLKQEAGATSWADRAVDLAEGQPDKRILAMARMRAAIIHMHSSDWEKANAIIDMVLDLKPLDAFVLGDAMLLRAQILLMQNDLEESRAMALKVLEMRTESGALHGQARAHSLLRDIAKQSGDFEAYIKHSETYQQISEQIRGASTARKIAIQEAQADIDRSHQERERERAILYSTLPQHIADRLIRGENVSGDEHANAAVLFVDIVGFTSHTSNMSATDTSALLERIFTSFDAICEKHGVVKIKTIGDSYMGVAFGEAASTEQRAANVALEMMAAEFYWPREASSDGMLADSREAVRFRIGLHSGPVVAGVIGTQRLQYDVWGDTVNTASRMESTGEPGRIQCSEAFASSLACARDDNDTLVIPSASEEPWNYRTVERGTIDIKGKGKMTTYWLEAAP